MSSLADCLELDVEDERAVGWYVLAHGLAAIGQIGRYGERSLAAHFHVLDANVPAFDDLAGAEAKAKWLARHALVELLAALLEAARVVDVSELAALGHRSVALFGLLDQDAVLVDLLLLLLGRFWLKKHVEKKCNTL